MPQLLLLDIVDNNVSIPDLGVKNIPAIKDLYLSGNVMRKVPKQIDTLQHTLSYLGVARCQLKNLGKIHLLRQLTYLDARNNSITSVSTELKTLMKERIHFESYFSGNPVCMMDTDVNCTALCTEYCWSHLGFSNGHCDESCNSKACNFDGGDCSA